MFPARALFINAYLACFDLLLTAACYLGLLSAEAHGWRWPVDWGRIAAPERILALGWILSLWLVLLASFGMYRSRRTASALSDLRILIRVAPAGLAALEGLAYGLPAFEPSPHFFFGFVAADFLCLSLARTGIRLLLHELRCRGYNLKTLLLVTSSALGDRLEAVIKDQAHYGYRLLPSVLYVPRGADEAERPWLEFKTHLNTTRIDDVILALPAEANSLTARMVNECENHGINVRLVPDLLPLIPYGTQTYDLGGIPLINVRLYPAEFFGYVVLKRVFDVVASSLILVALSPFFLLIALLIKITSPGPVFFAQERMGLNGRRFRMLKFRTMRFSAALDSNTHWTSPNDPHVTPLGRWLRRSNLDELPQFLNVLKGDMSVVGPRPERPFFIDRFRVEFPDYMLRHYVKSGLTGWAQVNGWRGDTSIKDRLAHDLYYIRNWALAFDFKILFLTLARTFFHRNAY
ncbi:MAG: undecaprenyl-phosphate glucose phosphotransferase [Acidobacteria bacterium]|nr:MAG: undecaprenyl-phosphate glucose phosphotransferase [Acidobacteriota bacterium]